MSRSAWHLIYLRVVSVVWLVRLQVYPVQSDIKAPAQELVSCRTSSLMRLFVLLYNKSSFCICMSFCCCCFCCFYIALWCFKLDCVENFCSVHILPDRFCKACVISCIYFFLNPHELPFLDVFLFCCSLFLLRGLIWLTKVKFYHGEHILSLDRWSSFRLSK